MARRKARPPAPLEVVGDHSGVPEPSTAAALAYLAAEEHVHGRVATAPCEVIQCLRVAYAIDFPLRSEMTRQSLAEALWWADCDKSGISREGLPWPTSYADSLEAYLRKADGVLATMANVDLRGAPPEPGA